MKPLRFFLVGCGRISHRHIRAIRENREQAELVGVSDARIGHAKALQEECRALGVNDSMNHEDFMIGCDTMNIDAICDDGRVVPVFRNGNWAF